jgi:glycosyltransferase involved in cell wall biosynthesis
MNKFFVSDLRWASMGELELPLWQEWNKKNSLPNWFWQRIWEYPYVVSKIPRSSISLDVGGTFPFVLFSNFPKAVSADCRNLNQSDHPLHQGQWPTEKLIICDAKQIPCEDNSFEYVFSISAIEEMPDMLTVLREMIRLAKRRVVITLGVSDALGISKDKLRLLEEFLGKQVPALPNDVLTSTSEVLPTFGQLQQKTYEHIRVLGITLDAADTPKSVGILMPHWESLAFLKPCLEYIQKNRNESLAETIYVLDDTSEDGSFEKAQELFQADSTIKFYQVERPTKSWDPDIGFLLDNGLSLMQEQYVAMIDADILPLSKDWLAFPIWLIEKYGLSAAGLDTGLSIPYLQWGWDAKHTWWQPANGYYPYGGIYDNQWFSVINNLYRVMPTALAKVVSENIGFTRGNEFNKGRKIRAPYLPTGCDNGVAANHFIDVNRMGPKFNLPATGYIGKTITNDIYGMNISDLLFHFVLSTRALSKTRKEIADAGETYFYWVEKIRAYSETGNPETIEEMIAASRNLDNVESTRKDIFKQDYEYVQKLLQEYRQDCTKI